MGNKGYRYSASGRDPRKIKPRRIKGIPVTWTVKKLVSEAEDRFRAKMGFHPRYFI